MPYGGDTAMDEKVLLLRRILVVWGDAPAGWIPWSQI